MPTSALPYCSLYQELIVDGKPCHRQEVYATFEALLCALKNIEAQHASKDATVGTAVTLTNRHGAKLDVGMSAEGWFLMLGEGRSTQLIFSSREADHYVPFLAPEWTEFPSSALHREEDACDAIRMWLERGAMLLFLVPGRGIDDLYPPY